MDILEVKFHNMQMKIGGYIKNKNKNIEKLSKILIKTSNAVEYIKSDIQNIEARRIDDFII